MNDSLIHFEKVVPDNLDLAIKTQHSIFPKENGALNLKASADEKYIKEVYEENHETTQY
jgi:hypothetical protein